MEKEQLSLDDLLGDNSLGKGEFESTGDADILAKLGLKEDDSGRAVEIKTDEDQNMDENDDAIRKAAVSKGVDIDLNLPEGSYTGAIILEKNDFIRAFNLAVPVMQTTSTLAYYKGLNIVPDVKSNQIKIISKNDVESFVYECKAVDMEYKMLDEVVCLESSLLQKILKVSGNHLLIYRKAVKDEVGNVTPGDLMIRLIDGDLILELKTVNFKDVLIEGQKGERISDISTDELGNVLKTMIPIANDGLKPENRNISFLGNQAYYKSTKFVVKYAVSTPEVVTKSLESEFLRRLCAVNRGKTITFYNVVGEGLKARRIAVECEDAYYTFITATPTMMEREKAMLDSAEEKRYISVDYTTFLRIITLASELPKATGAISIKALDKHLTIAIESKAGKSYFDCPAEVPAELVNNIEIRLFAGPLKKLLVAIVTERVDIAIEQSNIFIRSRDFVAVFMNIL